MISLIYIFNEHFFMVFVWWCTLKIIGMLVHFFYFMDILEEKKHIYIYIYVFFLLIHTGLLKTRTCLKHFKNELNFCKDFGSEDKLYCGTYCYNSCNTFSRSESGAETRSQICSNDWIWKILFCKRKFINFGIIFIDKRKLYFS
jgi:hypothetical protein